MIATKKMYFHLCGAISNALDAMEADNYGIAMDELKNAMIATEEYYINQ